MSLSRIAARGLMGAALVWLALSSAMEPAAAGEADVVAAELQREGPGRYTAIVTLRHADTGWTHYADRWEVLTPDGRLLGVRTLYHPHVEEQPFTRRLRGLEIPEAVARVTIRARDSRHGYGGAEIRLAVPR